MKCPNCRQRAVPFSEWGRGFTAFRCVCRQCGEPLRASRATWVWFAGILLTIPLYIVAGNGLAGWLGLSGPDQRFAFAVVAIPAIMGLSFVAWVTGTYARRN